MALTKRQQEVRRNLEVDFREVVNNNPRFMISEVIEPSEINFPVIKSSLKNSDDETVRLSVFLKYKHRGLTTCDDICQLLGVISHVIKSNPAVDEKVTIRFRPYDDMMSFFERPLNLRGGLKELSDLSGIFNNLICPRIYSVVELRFQVRRTDELDLFSWD